ncbi:MAG: TlpA family protein disulfide reductase [Planctomycetota bacterium]
MPRLRLLFALTLCAACSRQPQARIERPVIGKVDEGGERIGNKAPSLDGVRWVDGIAHPLSEDRGRVVLVRWWTDGCALCSNSAKAIGTLARRHGEGLVIRAIYHDKQLGRRVGPDRVRAFATRAGYSWLIGKDEGWEALKRWWLDPGRSFTSVTFLIDKRGVIRAIHSGGEFHDRTQVAEEDCLFEPAECEREFEALDRAVGVLMQERA